MLLPSQSCCQGSSSLRSDSPLQSICSLGDRKDPPAFQRVLMAMWSSTSELRYVGYRNINSEKEKTGVGR
jgi:hypothetical protein